MTDCAVIREAGWYRFTRRRVISTVTFLVLLFAACIYYAYQFDRDIPFNSPHWKGGNHHVRTHMVEDLLANHNGLTGMTRARIDEMLGPPDYQYGPDGPNNVYGPNCMYKYYLDQDYGLSLHFDTPEVRVRAVRLD